MPIARIDGHHMYFEVLGQGDPVLYDWLAARRRTTC
jgi:hypothetical protein